MQSVRKHFRLKPTYVFLSKEQLYSKKKNKTSHKKSQGGVRCEIFKKSQVILQFNKNKHFMFL